MRCRIAVTQCSAQRLCGRVLADRAWALHRSWMPEPVRTSITSGRPQDGIGDEVRQALGDAAVGVEPREVAGEQNSTLVMPVPAELLRFFEKMTPAGPGAELSPSLADFSDAEAVQAEAAIEGRPSAAGPDTVPPVEAITIPPVEAIAGWTPWAAS